TTTSEGHFATLPTKLTTRRGEPMCSPSFATSHLCKPTNHNGLSFFTWYLVLGTAFPAAASLAPTASMPKCQQHQGGYSVAHSRSFLKNLVAFPALPAIQCRRQDACLAHSCRQSRRLFVQNRFNERSL